VIIPVKLCPLCYTDVFWSPIATVVWTAEAWADFFRAGRTPICPGCGNLLVIGDDLELRLPFPSELELAAETLDEIEAVQQMVIAARAWRVP
jgi:hypothetical protein